MTEIERAIRAAVLAVEARRDAEECEAVAAVHGAMSRQMLCKVGVRTRSGGAGHASSFRHLGDGGEGEC